MYPEHNRTMLVDIIQHNQVDTVNSGTDKKTRNLFKMDRFVPCASMLTAIWNGDAVIKPFGRCPSEDVNSDGEVNTASRVLPSIYGLM